MIVNDVLFCFLNTDICVDVALERMFGNKDAGGTSDALTKRWQTFQLPHTSPPHSILICLPSLPGFQLNFQNRGWYFWSFSTISRLPSSPCSSSPCLSLNAFTSCILSIFSSASCSAGVALQEWVWNFVPTSWWLCGVWEAKAVCPEETNTELLIIL